jgi:hypothetical protein
VFFDNIVTTVEQCTTERSVRGAPTGFGWAQYSWSGDRTGSARGAEIYRAIMEDARARAARCCRINSFIRALIATHHQPVVCGCLCDHFLFL